VRASCLALFAALAAAPTAAATPGGEGGSGIEAAPAGAAPAAVLTSVGSADEGVRRELDEVIRRALLAEPSLELLSPAETTSQLMSLAEMGLVCLPEDVPCFVKLGIVANVSWVLVPVVDGAAGAVEVQIDLVDVAAGQRARSVRSRLARGDEEAVAVLVRRALGREAAAEPDPPPNPAVPTAPPLGALVAGAGGAVLGLSLAGAVLCDLIYTNTLAVADARTRRDVVQPLGLGLWLTTALGAATVGAGAYLLVNPPDDGPPPTAADATAR
jgi:hypothetical protein